MNVIIFPRGQLTKTDKARLEAAGIVGIEADNPSDVIQLTPATKLLRADDLALSAIEAIVDSGVGTGTFTRNLLKRMKANAVPPTEGKEATS